MHTNQTVGRLSLHNLEIVTFTIRDIREEPLTFFPVESTVQDTTLYQYGKNYV